MADVVVIEDDDNDSSPTEDVAPEIDTEAQTEIVEDVVSDLTDIVEDAAEDAAEAAAVEAVEDAVEEIVAEAAAVTTEAQFTELFRRLDTMQMQIDTISAPPELPTPAIVVVDDDAPIELDEDGIADGVVSDVEEGVPGTDTGPDDPPGKYSNDVDVKPDRKLGWKAFVLGGSGGTRGRRH